MINVSLTTASLQGCPQEKLEQWFSVSKWS